MNTSDDPTPPAARWHPVVAILAVSVLAVIVNCYPVVFCGKSFASSTGVPMLYDWWPPLPQMEPVPQTTNHGSDTPAMLIGEIPMGFIESRSVWQYGELPLWNRYGHCGYTLIGQAISMIGDPLQLIVILGHGSAGAWDIKYLVAKSLFCIGFGWLILRLTGNRLLSLIYAGLSAWCGAFFYINNHPVFFVFCYAPWILLSALEFLNLESRKYLRWGLVWLLANFACFNGGHVEPAVILIGGLNLTALLQAMLRYGNSAAIIKIVLRLGIGTALFLGLTAPVWMSFLGTLGDSYSSHSEIQVFQLPYQDVAGVFDDVFYNLLRTSDSLTAVGPGCSLLIFVGCVLSLLRWRQIKGEVLFWIVSFGILLPIGCIFALVPASFLEAIPFLNRVGHLDTDLSYLLIMQLTVQSAYGFNCLMEKNDVRRTAMELGCVALALAGMVYLFRFDPLGHLPIPWDYVVCAGAGAIGAPLLFSFLVSRQRRISAAGWLGIFILAFLPHFRFGLYNLGPDKWLMIPGVRAVLDAPSPAIDKIKAANPEPFRVVGMGVNLNGDYAAVYGLEDIRSSAPLSNRNLVELFQTFPGLVFGQDWVVVVANPAAAQPLLNMLNVKYLLGPPQVTLPQGLDFRVAGQSDFGVVENPEAWPRAFFCDQIVSLASNADFIKRLAQDGKKPFIALTPEEIEKEPALKQLESIQNVMVSPATNYQLLPNSTKFDVHATAAGVVCLTEGAAKNFTATANGEVKEVLTVNRAFKGIYLDKPGDYHIEFVYRPPHWGLACGLFWGALVMTIGIGFNNKGTKKQR
jgi:hypothetical protein